MGTRRRPRPSLPVLLAVLAAGPSVLAGAPRQAAPRIDDIVAALHHYVQDYEDKLTLIVADESYQQRVYNQASGLQLRATRQTAESRPFTRWSSIVFRLPIRYPGTGVSPHWSRG